MSASTSFRISSVAFPHDPEAVFRLTSGLGPSLAVLNEVHWIAFGLGNFGDAHPGVRVAIGARGDKFLANHSVPLMHSILRNSSGGVAFENLKIEAGASEGQSTALNHDWLSEVASRTFAKFDLRTTIPVATSLSDASYWASRYLSEMSVAADRCGVVLLLRPAEKPPGRHSFVRDDSPDRFADDASPFVRLKEYFTEIPIQSVSETREGKKSGPQKTISESGLGEHLRASGLQAIESLITTGAWWLSIRAFGTTSKDAWHAASAYLASMSAARTLGLRSQMATGLKTGLLSPPYEPAEDDAFKVLQKGAVGSDFFTLWGEREPTISDWYYGPRLRNILREAGLDTLFFLSDQKERKKRFESGTNCGDLKAMKNLFLPCSNEMLVSGAQLSAAIQLPVEPNPLTRVRRGFGYTAVPREDGARPATRLGHYGRGGVANRVTGASIQIENLTKHFLVVGATGCGKTTSVLAVLSDLRKSDEHDIHVTILEGAKTEYRAAKSLLSISDRDHFDFQQAFLPVHIFEHPQYVTPEEHLSQLTAVFQAMLELKAPMPSILREALADAYQSYHDEPSDSELKRMHPVRFWLLRSMKRLIADLGYAGENLATLQGAMRTRLAALSTGMAGTVLSGKGRDGERLSEDDLLKQFSNHSSLLELEGIADAKSRSLIMSLFVMYFRYALRSRRSKKLRHVLVLEEAHRIIGKPSDPSAGDATLEYFGNMLSEVRALGCSVVISDQSPSRLIDDAMRNTNTKLIMRLVSGEDIHAAVAGAGLPREAEADIPSLGPFEGILVSPDKLPAFVKVDGDRVFDELDTEESTTIHDLPSMRQQLRQDLRLTRLSLSVFSALYDGSQTHMKRAFESMAEALDEEPEILVEKARVAVGCDCDKPLKMNEYFWCAPHGERPAVHALSRTLRELS